MDIEYAAAPVSPQEATFRKAVQCAEPWSLDAPSLPIWLEDNWINHDEEDNAHPGFERSLQRKRRRDLVKRLEGADGFELLVSIGGWDQISHD